MTPDSGDGKARDGLGRVVEGNVGAATPDHLPTAPREVTARGRRATPKGARAITHVLALRTRTAAAVAVLVLALAGLYLFAAKPVYQASVVIQVDDPRGTGAVRQDLVALLEERSAASTEMELLRSRTLLESVVVAERLDVTAEAHYLPLIGRAVARRYDGDAPAPAPPRLASFAWGGERIRIGRLVVPDRLLGTPLTLTALGDGRYRVESPDGVLVEAGVVGEPRPAKGAGGFEVAVAELVARPGTRFDVARYDPAAVATDLARELVIQESGGKGSSGVLEITLEGERPTEIARILNAIASTRIRMTGDRRAQANAKAIEFLDAQLGTLRADVRRAELTLERYERLTGTPRLSQESQSVASQLAAIERETAVVDLQRAELSGRYGPEHPAVRTVERQLEELRRQRVALERRQEILPRAELESAQLAREVKVTSGAYDQLQARAQELRLLQPGALDGARIVDPAVPPRTPVRPKPLLVLASALLLALIAGVGAAIAADALRDTIEPPDDIERNTGLSVLVTVPHSRRQARLTRASAPGKPRVLAIGRPTDDAVEALRTLRTALQFTFGEGRSAIVALSSPAPRSGKSFVTANLAVLAAQAGRRVVLLDADLRRGELHRAFDVPRAPGLADLLAGEVALEAAARQTAVPGLDLLPTGPLPSNPAELLASKRFAQIIAAAKRRYDLVLIDTAPLLAVADGALAAAHADVNLVVLRVGHESLREVSLATERLRLAGTTVFGAVLNDVRPVRNSYGRYGKKYDYPGGRREPPSDVHVRDAS